MVDRINLLLKAKNITARQFAEEIGIQPSGMSHILSGRNNPSLDFVMKVVKRWPEININWLMFGKGEMYVGVSSAQPAAPSAEQQASTLNTETVVTDEPEQAQPLEYDLFSQPQTPPYVTNAPSSDPMPPVSSDPHHEDISAGNATTDSTGTKSVEHSVHSSVQPKSNLQSGKATAVSTKPELLENRLNESAQPPAVLQPNLVKKKIVKIIVLYDDHSFAEYFPE